VPRYDEQFDEAALEEIDFVVGDPGHSEEESDPDGHHPDW